MISYSGPIRFRSVGSLLEILKGWIGMVIGQVRYGDSVLHPKLFCSDLDPTLKIISDLVSDQAE